MTHFDVFNGDADGLCALHQLRLDTPESVLVTGVNATLRCSSAYRRSAGDAVTALDISAATNHAALVALLDRGVGVDYFDHHYAGDLPAHPTFTATSTRRRACARHARRPLPWRKHASGPLSPRSATTCPLPRTSSPRSSLCATSRRRSCGSSANIAYNAYGEKKTDLSSTRRRCTDVCIGTPIRSDFFAGSRSIARSARLVATICDGERVAARDSRLKTPRSTSCPKRPGADAFVASSSNDLATAFPTWRMPSSRRMRKADTRSACARRARPDRRGRPVPPVHDRWRSGRSGGHQSSAARSVAGIRARARSRVCQ